MNHSEPLQPHPVADPRRSQYTTEPRPVEDLTIVNIGGYDGLIAFAAGRGIHLSRDPSELERVDGLVTAASPLEGRLWSELGMFYGDVLTHSVPRAYWTRHLTNELMVRITRRTWMDVLSVATNFCDPNHDGLSLVANYAHVLMLVRDEEPIPEGGGR